MLYEGVLGDLKKYKGLLGRQKVKICKVVDCYSHMQADGYHPKSYP